MSELLHHPANLSEVLCLMAHDLRNPLSALLTNLNYLRALSPAQDQDAAEAFGDATLSCSVLEQLIANLDALGRLIHPDEVRPKSFSVRAELNAAVARARPHAELGSIQLVVDNRADAALGFGVPEYVALCLDNLLANCVQYGNAGDAVRVVLSAKGRSVILELSDEGPIVPEELRERVLSIAGQLESKQSLGARYGRGLGLFCAHGAARLGGAHMSIEQVEGRASFRVVLPAVAAVESPA